MFVSGEFRKRFVLKKARKKAVEALMKDGFKLIGSARTSPVDYDTAYKLVHSVDDNTVWANLPRQGELWDNIVQRLQDLVQWIKDHHEEILKIISIILSLALLFLDDNDSDTKENAEDKK